MNKIDLAVKKPRKLKWSTLRLSFITIIVCICLGLVFLFWYSFGTDEAGHLQTINIENELVRVLDVHFADHGKYPNTLNSLVPKYLKQIKSPKWGKKWLYKCLEDGYAYKLLTGYKKKDGSYGPALYYYSNAHNSSEWLYFDQDDSIEMK